MSEPGVCTQACLLVHFTSVLWRCLQPDACSLFREEMGGGVAGWREEEERALTPVVCVCARARTVWDLTAPRARFLYVFRKPSVRSFHVWLIKTFDLSVRRDVCSRQSGDLVTFHFQCCSSAAHSQLGGRTPAEAISSHKAEVPLPGLIPPDAVRCLQMQFKCFEILV